MRESENREFLRWNLHPLHLNDIRSALTDLSGVLLRAPRYNTVTLNGSFFASDARPRADVVTLRVRRKLCVCGSVRTTERASCLRFLWSCWTALGACILASPSKSAPSRTGGILGETYRGSETIDSGYAILKAHDRPTDRPPPFVNRRLARPGEAGKDFRDDTLKYSTSFNIYIARYSLCI